MRLRNTLAGLLSLFASLALAQPAEPSTRFSLKVGQGAEPGAMVSGELKLPASPRERLPAVVILHSTPGFDGRGAFYAEALNAAGIATVEIDYMQGRGMPASPRGNLPHVYETLQYLAAHPRIDPLRIGVMGFSWGGILAVLTSSEELTRQYAGSLRFGAHLGLYPICWRHEGILAGKSSWKDLPPRVYHRVTGRPVHILAGARDDFDDDEAACTKFVAALPSGVKPHFSHTVYPGATFAWDTRFGYASYDGGAKKGKGGIITVIADAEAAKRSREFAVAFFGRNLEP